MPDVLDFLILRQVFDTSVSRNWRPGIMRVTHRSKDISCKALVAIGGTCFFPIILM